MLHAKDLRLGNKVYNHKNEVVSVQQILCNTIIYDTQINVSRKVAANISRYYEDAYDTQVIEVIKEVDFQDIEAIELTPKVLEKCGFRNYIRDEWIIKFGNSYLDFEMMPDGLKLRHPIPSSVGIKYVHQLQNFFYAVTGQELEVSL